MAAGDYGAGLDPAGLEHAETMSARTTPSAIVPFFDPYERGYPYAPGGEELISVHPVMQTAAFLLGNEKGSIPSTPDLGFDVLRVRRARPDKAEATFIDEVRVCLDRLVRAGDLRIVSVTATLNSAGVFGTTTLQNLRDPDAKPENFPVRY